MPMVPGGGDQLALLKDFTIPLVVLSVFADSFESLSVRVDDSEPPMLFIVLYLALSESELTMGIRQDPSDSMRLSFGVHLSFNNSVLSPLYLHFQRLVFLFFAFDIGLSNNGFLLYLQEPFFKKALDWKNSSLLNIFDKLLWQLP